ncbi:hypothetical protein [Deinococcus sp.]|uniref:hypothetical protein n=1 Tax=Deinococcus sp. TaxID=47478 RepID=UPI003C7E9BE6
MGALLCGQALAQTTPATPSTTRRYLQALPSQEIKLTYTVAGVSVTHTFKGALLSDLLTAARPGFGHRGVLLAYEQDGVPLPASDGALRLVVPGDLKGGHSVSSLLRVTVLPASAPN